MLFEGGFSPGSEREMLSPSVGVREETSHGQLKANENKFVS